MTLEEKRKRHLEFVELYNKGIPVKQIARKYGVSKSTVDTGITSIIGKRSVTHSEETKNKVVELRNRGFSYGDIGKELGISANTACSIVRNRSEKEKNTVKKELFDSLFDEKIVEPTMAHHEMNFKKFTDNRTGKKYHDITDQFCKSYELISTVVYE